MEWPFRNHTNDQLLLELRTSHRGELGQLATVLRILEEVDRRNLYAELGFPSLYQFCIGSLHLSEHEAYLRMTVARTARRFPLIFEMIEKDELHLTAVAKLAPHLTAENQRSLLEAAVHKTKHEIEELIAARFPAPDVTGSIRRAKTPAPSLVHVPASAPLAPPSLLVPSWSLPQTPAQAPKPDARPDTIRPLSPERYAIRFTASGRCRELLERAKALMSHRAPGADVGDIVEESLSVLVEKLEKQKFKTTARPRPKTSEPKNGRHIPAEVKRIVHARDGGRCTYIGPGGHRCEARSFLEFDHKTPVALGGKSTADNVRLRCRVHNGLAARQVFGDQEMTLWSSGFRPVSKTSRKSSVQTEQLPSPP